MAIYVGVNGVAKKVKQVYIGVDDKAEIIYKDGIVPVGYYPVEYITPNTDNDCSLTFREKIYKYSKIIFTVGFDPNYVNTTGKSKLCTLGQFSTVSIRVTSAGALQAIIGSITHNIASNNGHFRLKYVYTINKTANCDSYYQRIEYNGLSPEISIGTNIDSFGGDNQPCYFWRDNSGNNKQLGSYIYSCVIYSDMAAGGQLTRNFIPCINQNGMAGFYDSVSGEFLGNNNLTNGPIITP